MKVLYFARVRQIAGKSEESVEPPASVKTVSDLMDYLASRDASVAEAFGDRRRIRAALDQSHVALDASIGNAREAAFFPPVTGG